MHVLTQFRMCQRFPGKTMNCLKGTKRAWQTFGIWELKPHSTLCPSFHCWQVYISNHVSSLQKRSGFRTMSSSEKNEASNHVAMVLSVYVAILVRTMSYLPNNLFFFPNFSLPACWVSRCSHSTRWPWSTGDSSRKLSGRIRLNEKIMWGTPR